MHRKSLSQIVFNFWVKEELKDRNLLGKFLFGPYYLDKPGKKIITYRETVEIFLEDVDTLRINERYNHLKCSGIKKIYIII